MRQAFPPATHVCSWVGRTVQRAEDKLARGDIMWGPVTSSPASLRWARSITGLCRTERCRWKARSHSLLSQDFDLCALLQDLAILASYSCHYIFRVKHQQFGGRCFVGWAVLSLWFGGMALGVCWPSPVPVVFGVCWLQGTSVTSLNRYLFSFLSIGKKVLTCLCVNAKMFNFTPRTK